MATLHRSNADLIDDLVRTRVITDAKVEASMRAVDRADFVPPGGSPYEDAPVSMYGWRVRMRLNRLAAPTFTRDADAALPSAAYSCVCCHRAVDMVRQSPRRTSTPRYSSC